MARPIRPTSCTRPRCERVANAQGLCRPHQKKLTQLRAARGDFERVSAVAAVQHLRVLRNRGWIWRKINRLAHMSHRQLQAVYTGHTDTIRRCQAAAILAIEPVWYPSTCRVSAVGIRRRIEGLAFQGWPIRTYAPLLGYHKDTISRALQRDYTTAAVAAAVAEFAEKHAYAPGPNPQFAARARTTGALPLAAWSDDTIDDPEARPEGLPKRARRRLDVQEVIYLREVIGLSFPTIAEKLDFKVTSIRDVYSAEKKRQAEREDEEDVA